MRLDYLRLTTADQLQLQGLLYQPDQPTKNILIHVHGMAGNFYENWFVHVLAEMLGKHGWALLTVNNRGHDYIAQIPKLNNQDGYLLVGNVFERFEDCVADIQAVVDYATDHSFTNLVLQGHSLGASKIVYYWTQTTSQPITKLILAAPADMVGLFQQEQDYPQKIAHAKELITLGKGKELLPNAIWDWYWLSAATYLNFALPGNAIDIINTHAPETSSQLSLIDIPTLLIMGSHDDAVIHSLSTEQALITIKQKMFNAPQITTQIIPEADHTYLGHEQLFAIAITDWLSSK